MYEERIEELELENMELKKSLAAAQGGGRVSPTPAPTKSASPTGGHVSPTRVSPTLSPQGAGQGGRAKSPLTLSPPAPAPEPEPSSKSPPDPKPRAMRRPGARGVRGSPGSPGSPAPVKVKGHRRGSTVGLERAGKGRAKGRRQPRKAKRRMSLMSTLSHQVIPPLPSLFTLLRPYLAHFSPVFSRFLCVFTAWPRRFHRAPSRNPGPRNSWQGDQEGRTPPFVRHPRR